MRAAVIAKQGTPVHENVHIVDDWPEPQAKPGEVVLRVEASALNQLDLWVGRGVPGLDLEYPRISGSDVCGIVEAIGEGVDDAWKGRRVILNAAVPKPDPVRPDVDPAMHDIRMIGEHWSGVHGERLAVPVAQVKAVGDADPVQAAAFGLTFLTAWRCLVTRAEMKAGDTLLVPGIGGGVATAALKIGRHLGCRVIVTSRHQWKLDRAIELGASDGILDKGEDWSRQVRAMTGKRGVDIVLDSVGKATHLSSIKSLARGGAYVSPGCTTGPAATTDLARLFWLQLRIIGSTMGSMEEFGEVVSLFNAGHLEPVVDQVFDGADAPAAFARLESGEQFGKIVLKWS